MGGGDARAVDWVAPGVTKAGGVSERAVDFMSIYPTLCDLAGIERPKHVEGEVITALLKNPRAEWEKPALTTFRRNNHTVRSERWRYIRYADGGEELYDHDADPHEWRNVADDPGLESVKRSLARHMPLVNQPELPRQARQARQRAR